MTGRSGSGIGERRNGAVTLFLCGDVMTGRGIDQVLPHPSPPALHEPYVRDAREYLELAEAANGPIPRAVDWPYVWGDAIDELARVKPDARIINLETSITQSGEYWRGKDIHYRMHPGNLPVLTAAQIDLCVLANNHVLDYGVAGLVETLDVLQRAGIPAAGAGRNAAEAQAPRILRLATESRLLVCAAGSETSGVPRAWAAGKDRPGVDVLPDLSEASASALARRARASKRPNDVVLVSIHWGSNWGYEIPDEQVRFAHALIDAGVDIVHGHSSHHARPIEVYRGRLILYGCGDFITDYEGISGYEEYRDDLVLMYFAMVDAATGTLMTLRMSPMQLSRFRLNRACGGEAAWLRDRLEATSARFGSRVCIDDNGRLVLDRGEKAL
jgi:poly-gamma-glutamate synthesis protein (capsule biosynthesis protein)